VVDRLTRWGRHPPAADVGTEARRPERETKTTARVRRRGRWWRGGREEEGAMEPPRMCGRCGWLAGWLLPSHRGCGRGASWLLF